MLPQLCLLWGKYRECNLWMAWGSGHLRARQTWWEKYTVTARWFINKQPIYYFLHELSWTLLKYLAYWFQLSSVVFHVKAASLLMLLHLPLRGSNALGLLDIQAHKKIVLHFWKYYVRIKHKSNVSKKDIYYLRHTF